MLDNHTPSARVAAFADDPVTFPTAPPAAWFHDLPDWLDTTWEAGLVQINPQGRVAALVAPYGECILDGGSNCWMPPTSPTGYEYAHVGTVISAEGEPVRVANIGGGVSHYDLRDPYAMSPAVKHYSNTATRVMVGRYHDRPDAGGIVFLGSMWPTASELDVVEARASALSGDWRWVESLGGHDMAGAQLVNNPGFRPNRQRRNAMLSLGVMNFAVAASLAAPGGMENVALRGTWTPQPGSTYAVLDRLAEIEAVLAHLLNAAVVDDEPVTDDDIADAETVAGLTDDAGYPVAVVAGGRHSRRPNPLSSPKEIAGRHGHKPHGPSIRWPALYEHLKAKGYSKQKAAMISNGQWRKRHGLPPKSAPGSKGKVRVASVGTPVDLSGAVINGEPVTGANIVLVPDDPAALAVPGGDPEDILHVTVKYLNQAESWTDTDREQVNAMVGDWARRHGPFTATVGGVGTLGDNGAVVYHLDVPGLTDARGELSDRIDSETVHDTSDTYDGYTPHLTAGYNLDPMPDRPTDPVTFSRARVQWADQGVEFPLGEPQAYTAAGRKHVRDADKDGKIFDGTPKEQPYIPLPDEALSVVKETFGGSDKDVAESWQKAQAKVDAAKPDEMLKGGTPNAPGVHPTAAAAQQRGKVHAKVTNPGRMKKFAEGDTVEVAYRDAEFGTVWTTDKNGKNRKYLIRWDKLGEPDLDAKTTEGYEFATSDQVKAAAASQGKVGVRVGDGRLWRAGIGRGDHVDATFVDDQFARVTAPNGKDYLVRWERFDAVGTPGGYKQAAEAPGFKVPDVPTTPEVARTATQQRLDALFERADAANATYGPTGERWNKAVGIVNGHHVQVNIYGQGESARRTVWVDKSDEDLTPEQAADLIDQTSTGHGDAPDLKAMQDEVTALGHEFDRAMESENWERAIGLADQIAAKHQAIIDVAPEGSPEAFLARDGQKTIGQARRNLEGRVQTPEPPSGGGTAAPSTPAEREAAAIGDRISVATENGSVYDRLDDGLYYMRLETPDGSKVGYSSQRGLTLDELIVVYGAKASNQPESIGPPFVKGENGGWQRAPEPKRIGSADMVSVEDIGIGDVVVGEDGDDHRVITIGRDPGIVVLGYEGGTSDYIPEGGEVGRISKSGTDEESKGLPQVGTPEFAAHKQASIDAYNANPGDQEANRAMAEVLEHEAAATDDDGRRRKLLAAAGQYRKAAGDIAPEPSPEPESGSVLDPDRYEVINATGRTALTPTGARLPLTGFAIRDKQTMELVSSDGTQPSMFRTKAAALENAKNPSEDWGRVRDAVPYPDDPATPEWLRRMSDDDLVEMTSKLDLGDSGQRSTYADILDEQARRAEFNGDSELASTYRQGADKYRQPAEPEPPSAPEGGDAPTPSPEGDTPEPESGGVKPAAEAFPDMTEWDRSTVTVPGTGPDVGTYTRQDFLYSVNPNDATITVALPDGTTKTLPYKAGNVIVGRDRKTGLWDAKVIKQWSSSSFTNQSRISVNKAGADPFVMVSDGSPTRAAIDANAMLNTYWAGHIPPAGEAAFKKRLGQLVGSKEAAAALKDRSFRFDVPAPTAVDTDGIVTDPVAYKALIDQVLGYDRMVDPDFAATGNYAATAEKAARSAHARYMAGDPNVTFPQVAELTQLAMHFKVREGRSRVRNSGKVEAAVAEERVKMTERGQAHVKALAGESDWAQQATSMIQGTITGDLKDALTSAEGSGRKRDFWRVGHAIAHITALRASLNGGDVRGGGEMDESLLGSWQGELTDEQMEWVRAAFRNSDLDSFDAAARYFTKAKNRERIKAAAAANVPKLITDMEAADADTRVVIGMEALAAIMDPDGSNRADAELALRDAINDHGTGRLSTSDVDEALDKAGAYLQFANYIDKGLTSGAFISSADGGHAFATDLSNPSYVPAGMTDSIISRFGIKLGSGAAPHAKLAEETWATLMENPTFRAQVDAYGGPLLGAFTKGSKGTAWAATGTNVIGFSKTRAENAAKQFRSAAKLIRDRYGVDIEAAPVSRKYLMSVADATDGPDRNFDVQHALRVASHNTDFNEWAILAHEYGHIVDGRLSGRINQDERNAFYAFVNGHRSVIAEVSDYATTNRAETFAEFYATVMHPNFKDRVGYSDEAEEAFRLFHAMITPPPRLAGPSATETPVGPIAAP